ncbi:DUF7344 domain-containing protein [Halomicrococcus sp. NG-SE-24]|uniref:DUF7344 domain-containing protein n=1 Tax=Halomicrococcus sp. NG-SE-24 TaxID=3436928 RepID=UPI003D96007F
METDPRSERIDGLLADGCNRSILTVLDKAGRSLHVMELAERLVAREMPVARTSQYEDELDRVRISLHHYRLPKLDEAGLVEYDSTANVAKSRDSTDVDADWLDAGRIDEQLDRLTNGSEAAESDVGTIEGREMVIEHGRHLADEATDELFLMYVREDLLEDECICHAVDAIERGVDIYLGSQNRNVRDVTRRRLPEATIWEPDLDWMNAPSRYPKVGRLVFADREKVMLGLLEESADAHAETAVVGEGETNPLVVLVRELLGPRLDHLDFQSDDFRQTFSF